MKIYSVLLALFFTSIVFGQDNCQHYKTAQTASTSTPPINNNAKSDTLDILHIDLNMDMTAVNSGSIAGVATLTIVPMASNIHLVNLDFLTLHVDSVKFNDSLDCTYNFSSGPSFPIELPDTLSANDTFKLAIYYHGNPVTDASGWGGFHFNNPYYFNLGVGFAANPHTFGRAWFPCFDNFVERQTFSFHIKTSGGRKAYCNGLRTLLDTNSFGGDTVVSHWEMTDEIPAYLTSIAMSNYQELWGLHNNVPSLILARTNDTTAVRGSFTNLYPIFDAFENNYGPYKWQKIGYTLTPIGAMEHATSIHYPRTSVIGNLINEDIVAHELAHHWFGNLITCETAGDMWINEGMAEYLSHQYEEAVHGIAAYKKATVDNHSYVIQFAKVADDGHQALYGLPNELTYGAHTYQKGAMVGYNLRGYLGDGDFFSGLTQLLDSNAFSAINSAEFRDQLGNFTTYDLTSFFDDWVFNPGYPDFNIDSMQVVISAIPEKTVHVRISQRLLATSKRFTNVPLQITLHDNFGNEENHDVLFLSADTTYTFLSPYAIKWATINEDNHIFTATSSSDYHIKSQQNFIDNRTKMNLYSGAVTDSATVRIEHHWVGPSTTGNENFRVSTSRYWRVTGVFPSSFSPSARLEFSSFANTGNLDEDLLANGEDSLMLVYRKDASEEWQEYAYYTKSYMGSPSNKFGRIEIQLLQPGEYAFANGVSIFGLEEFDVKNSFTLYPNPTSDKLMVEFDDSGVAEKWTITDVKGSMVKRGNKQNTEMEINISDLPAGVYFFNLSSESQKFIVN